MKKMISLVFLATILLVSESFTGKRPEKAITGNNAPVIALAIDGAAFDARESSNYSAQLTNNSKTASITLLGNEVHDKAGHVYPTKMQIDYAFKNGILGEVNVENLCYEYNNQKYYVLPTSAFMSISKVKWSADKKSCVICADIFCKVQQHFVMEEYVPVFVIRGELENLTVTMPAS